MRFRTCLVAVVLAALALSSCNSAGDSKAREVVPVAVQGNHTSERPAGEYSVETYSTGGGQWGYRILDGGKLVIDQPHIPAIQGNRGFDSPEKAEKAALFVVGKMRAGLMPPAVTQTELDSLGVL